MHRKYIASVGRYKLRRFRLFSFQSHPITQRFPDGKFLCWSESRCETTCRGCHKRLCPSPYDLPLGIDRPADLHILILPAPVEIRVVELFLSFLHDPERLPDALPHNHDGFGPECGDFLLENDSALFQFLLAQPISAPRRPLTYIGIANLVQVHQVSRLSWNVLLWRDTTIVKEVPESIGWMCISMPSRGCHKPWIEADADQGQSWSQAVYQIIGRTVRVLCCTLFSCAPPFLKLLRCSTTFRSWGVEIRSFIKLVGPVQE